MNKTAIIIAGLVVFLVGASFPFWFTAIAGNDDLARPQLEKATETPCILPQVEMQQQHMDLLNNWRDEVVREGTRYFKHNDKVWEKSLTKACLGCHQSRKNFCAKCHQYVGIDPYCWDCHLDK